MTEQVARTFIDGLHRLESDRDLEAIIATFAEQCEVGNVVSPEQFSGRDGAREFWSKYRDAFGEVHSTFRNVISGDGAAALEWTTEGTNPKGDPFRYDGVSILEVQDGRITRFRAYFNPAALGHQLLDPSAPTSTAEQA